MANNIEEKEVKEESFWDKVKNFFKKTWESIKKYIWAPIVSFVVYFILRRRKELNSEINEIKKEIKKEKKEIEKQTKKVEDSEKNLEKKIEENKKAVEEIKKDTEERDDELKKFLPGLD